ncbi:MAG: hypothetical protein HYR49_00200 [Gammaproteobacteria bacterium]|nr:hypothetical protein [Gammaproteobacteria bacterium]
MTTQTKPPLAALILGVLGFCFGAFGLLGGVQDLALPYLFSIQKQMAEVSQPKPADPDCPEREPALPGVDPGWSQELRQFVSGPPWYPRYSMGMGVVRLLLGAGCMLASLFLILVRPGADFFFMLVLGLSAARNLTAVGIGIAAGSLFSFWAVVGGVVGFVLDIMLLVVCVVSDRTPYRAV